MKLFSFISNLYSILDLTVDCCSNESGTRSVDEITTPGTIIISPNHPNGYENSKDCQISIRFSGRVRIKFEAFNIEDHRSCGYDYLEVRDGEGSSSSLIGSRLCGTTIPSAIESSGSSMTLNFHTDGSVVRPGFKIITELGKNRSGFSCAYNFSLKLHYNKSFRENLTFLHSQVIHPFLKFYIQILFNGIFDNFIYYPSKNPSPSTSIDIILLDNK